MTTLLDCEAGMWQQYLEYKVAYPNATEMERAFLHGVLENTLIPEGMSVVKLTDHTQGMIDGMPYFMGHTPPLMERMQQLSLVKPGQGMNEQMHVAVVLSQHLKVLAETATFDGKKILFAPSLLCASGPTAGGFSPSWMLQFGTLHIDP